MLVRIAQTEMAADATQVCRVVESETNAIELRRLSLAGQWQKVAVPSFMLRPVVRSCLDTGSFFQATSGTNNRDSWPLVEDDALQCFVAIGRSHNRLVWTKTTSQPLLTVRALARS